MQYIHLGRTGLKVSRLALGTANFGKATDENECDKIMDHALESGMNLFDTASNYGPKKGEGSCEQIIGRWLDQSPERRNQIIIATKVYYDIQPEGQNNPNLDVGLSARKIIKCCEDSLRRLKTDQIDIFQLHHIDRSCPWDEIWQALETLLRQGKILYTSSSNFAGWDIATACQEASKRNLMGLVSEQSIYNLDNRWVELEVLPSCRHYGMGFLAWGPLSHGLLSGSSELRTKGRRSGQQYDQKIISKLQQLKSYKEFCHQLGQSPALVALAWLLNNPLLTAPIIGPRTAAQLLELIPATELVLDAKSMETLDTIWPGPGGEAPEAYAW